MKLSRSILPLLGIALVAAQPLSLARAEVVSAAPDPHVELWTEGTGRYYVKATDSLLVTLKGSGEYQIINGCPINCYLVVNGSVRQLVPRIMRSGVINLDFGKLTGVKPGTPVELQFRINDPARVPHPQTLFRTVVVQ